MIGLIADIGGTNIRFALCRPDGGWFDEATLTCADFRSPVDAARRYLDQAAPRSLPRIGAMCVACPVDGDDIDVTNNSWRFSAEAVRRGLDLDRLEFVNDFAANALSAADLATSDRIQVGGGTARPGHPVAALGPGTGLGVGFLVPTADGFMPVSGEGGHVTLAPATGEEQAVLEVLRRRFEHVSAERVISGTGLVTLYEALCTVHGRRAEALEPAHVGTLGATGQCEECRAALEMMFAMLGTVAGNLALTVGARGGVYVMGGIVPRYLDLFADSSFRTRFEAKGRFRSYLKEIPTFAVTHPNPAFVGLVRLVSRLAAEGA